MPNSTSAAIRTRSWLKATAVYREPRVIAILLLGFSSGLPLALTAGTLAIWMTEVGVDLTTIGLFAVVATPYSLKVPVGADRRSDAAAVADPPFRA